MGTFPLAHHGLPPRAPQRNQEWPREEQEPGCGNGAEIPSRDSHALGTSPAPVMGLGWRWAHHPPLMGPGQGPAGCRGQSPH